MTPRIGVLALQGGVREHRVLLHDLGAQVRGVRTAADLHDLEGLVLPGGESSVMDRLARAAGLLEPLRRAIAAGLPTLGTCAGLVLLARDITDPAPGQRTLGTLDIGVRRNAFGPQACSAEAIVPTTLGDVRAVFIRAPEVIRAGPGVEILARYRGAAVAVRHGHMTAVSFHPELTGDPTFHQELLAAASGRGGQSERG